MNSKRTFISMKGNQHIDTSPIYSSHDIRKRRNSHRANLPKPAVKIMWDWLSENRYCPYPKEDAKITMSETGNITVLQVNNWFINARRRILPKLLESEGKSANNYLARRNRKNSQSLVTENKQLCSKLLLQPSTCSRNPLPNLNLHMDHDYDQTYYSNNFNDSSISQYSIGDNLVVYDNSNVHNSDGESSDSSNSLIYNHYASEENMNTDFLYTDSYDNFQNSPPVSGFIVPDQQQNLQCTLQHQMNNHGLNLLVAAVNQLEMSNPLQQAAEENKTYHKL